MPIYKEALPETVRAFQPDIVLVSAGYDLHQADPLAQLNVTTEGIGDIVSAIMESTPVPKLFFLEGGYDLDALGQSVSKTIQVMRQYEEE